ncbi:MAG TPA: ferrous iron transport protein A [Candidatus Aerophobetes bacterium]|uniref:Ferrous iron transport protein A n=1 Tax=Aerophobetes bacterium TaxID=2030807 RepID=A0A7V5LZD9_UNCAE|nr:ferrous iron transport protein A [Candidatus Aerophobetes bacterium]
MFTLLDLPAGEIAEVVAIGGGWGVQRNLAALGLVPGRKVRKITAQPIGGPVLVEIVGGGKVAIGRGMAAKVFLRK